MKYLWIGLMIAALMIAGCFWGGREIGRRAEAVAASLEDALNALESGDPARAWTLAAEAAAEWARHETLLEALVSHERTDGIGAALAELKWLEGPALGRACEGLLRQIRDLEYAETPRLSNIL